MDTFLKLTSIPKNKQCNCITPFFLADLNGINPTTGRNYTDDERSTIRSAVLRMSNAKNCTLSSCCDPRADYKSIDPKFLNTVASKFSHYQLINKNGSLHQIYLWDIENAKEEKPDNNWKSMEPYIVCKISKAEIKDHETIPYIKVASKLVNDCFINNCDNTEILKLENIIAGSKVDMNNTFVDDMKVVSSIKDGDLVYLKEYIRTYGMVDQPLTNDNENNRILHLVAQYGTPDMLDLILALKPKLDITNVDGDTPLHLSSLSGKVDNTEKLIGQGAPLNIPNINKEFPIHKAIQSGNFELVRLLYNNGAGLMYYDKNGNNLLHYTVLYAPENENKVPLMQFLLEHGLNSEEKNKQGKTALELTKMKLDKLDKSSYLKKYLTGNEKKTGETSGVAKYVVVNDDDYTEGFENTSSDTSSSWWSSIPSYFGSGSQLGVGSLLSGYIGGASSTNITSTTTTLPETSSSVVSSTDIRQKQNLYNNKAIKVELPVKYDKEGLLIEDNEPKINEPVQIQQPNMQELSQGNRNLLEIQTMLFNNILVNNKEKYLNKYININDVPKGGPVMGLYDLCVGENVNGTEDSEECLAKGGRLAKVKNATTRIKLQMIPASNQSKIDAIKDEDLMMPKYGTTNPEEYNIQLADMIKINLEKTNTKMELNNFEDHPPMMEMAQVKQTETEAVKNAKLTIEGFENGNHSNKKLIIILIIILLLILLIWYLVSNI
jgi:ankyrin repeat protein